LHGYTRGVRLVVAIEWRASIMDPESRRRELQDAIAGEEAHLAIVEGEVRAVRERLDSLRRQLDIAAAPAMHGPPSRDRTPTAAAPSEKVRLFRALFRGRDDVFPVQFLSKKTGRIGYAPACSNKFVRGLCDLPRIKCGECRNQAFLPVDDKAVFGHLQGRQVMGIYPLLRDETCWFLAVDFDKHGWREDVLAFVETCRTAGIPVAIERSRSGNGAHAWFFFSEPVAASAARQMGCALLTETMSRRHELSMDSYDRLFPSQDTLPRGGFGNLIALPLQHGPRQQGNSVFLDERLDPYPDAEQWMYLATVQRISPAKVEWIVEEARQRGGEIGVPMPDPFDADEGTPWTRPPSGMARVTPITEPLPARVRAVHAQRIFVEKHDMPAALINQIKRLAAFQNPEFYKKQNMRLSTAATPRVLACAQGLPRHIALPRGCLDDLRRLILGHGVDLEVQDERISGQSIAVEFRGQLTVDQEKAAQVLLAEETGLFVAPPGVGKTVVGTYLIAARARNTLILVHRRPLLDQWVARLALFLGIEPKAIGQIRTGKRTVTGQIDVAMIQSLVKKGAVADIVASYGQVIVDECHHVPAVSFERVLAEVKAKYVVGLTATLQRRDGHHPITQMQLGPVRFEIAAKSPAALRPFAHRLFIRETRFNTPIGMASPTIQELYASLASDAQRNELILNDVIAALDEGRSPILLTERKDHLEFFASRLRPFARNLVVLRGGMSAKAQRAVAAQLSGISADEERLVLATGRYIGEGFDDARLDTLFLALPVSWKGILVQYAGRLHRQHPGKYEVQIYDYVDSQVPMLGRMFERRLRGYRAIGYSSSQDPIGDDECDEPIVDYDNPGWD
jgi:superfamily II DNA or RNA helicase